MSPQWRADLRIAHVAAGSLSLTTQAERGKSVCFCGSAAALPLLVAQNTLSVCVTAAVTRQAVAGKTLLYLLIFFFFFCILASSLISSSTVVPLESTGISSSLTQNLFSIKVLQNSLIVWRPLPTFFLQLECESQLSWNEVWRGN